MHSRLASLSVVLSLLLPVNLLNAQGVGGSITAPVSHSVQGVPFCADIINEHKQVLSDGNRIDQETHGKMCRDSQGRTRNETEMALPSGDKQQHISIHDPVQQVNILLDPSRKTAQVHNFPSAAPNVSRPVPFQPQEHPAMSPNIEQLGQMTIEGINAVGMRITRTTPANTIGNAEPLVAVTETWRSPELNIVLLTKNSNPQHGDTVYKLVNIQRVEPDPALFQIPPDYEVDDYPAPK
jgi:hypothetical protein